jgi:hypothetical protein
MDVTTWLKPSSAVLILLKMSYDVAGENTDRVSVESVLSGDSTSIYQ